MLQIKQRREVELLLLVSMTSGDANDGHPNSGDGADSDSNTDRYQVRPYVTGAKSDSRKA